MKLVNIKEVEQFRKVVRECEGDVYLKSTDTKCGGHRGVRRI